MNKHMTSWKGAHSMFSVITFEELLHPIRRFLYPNIIHVSLVVVTLVCVFPFFFSYSHLNV